MITCVPRVQAQPTGKTVRLQSKALQLGWQQTAAGWQLQQLQVKAGNQWMKVDNPLGAYTFLYDPVKPDTVPLVLKDQQGQTIHFPEPNYTYMTDKWREITSPVSLNTAGTVVRGFPGTVNDQKDSLVFTQETPQGIVTAVWKIDPQYEKDVCVTLTLTARQAGYYSLASPTLCRFAKDRLEWAVIPGIFQGRAINPDFVNAYAYGWGIPDRPVVVRERTAAALTSILTNKEGISVAMIAEPGMGRDPFESDTNTHRTWQLGLSLMSRDSLLTPVGYHPVLGEKGSFLQKGEQATFRFRYHLQKAGWYSVYQHVVNDVYRFDDFLSLKQTRQSLTDRILAMHRYVLSDSTSKWRTAQTGGLTIGAQDYLGGVYGAKQDAMKNSDYGAMWMMGRIMEDSLLRTTRLPFARNYKLAQQQQQGPFKGAAAGQYYLWKSDKFTEEWGPYSEPIGLTYYMLMDMGNILLFEPGDTELRNRVRAAADRLLAWMQPDGHWVVAYDDTTHKALFTELEDYRPTFYGMVIAYRLLKDPKYLAAARKGADWYLQQAVKEGRFLGVCGDNRFTADFATAQSAQALIELYELTNDKRYQKAAIEAARFYTTSIYTHPIPTKQVRQVQGRVVEDWAISQVGLSYEHGGTMGSANRGGPILLASHAGLFVRMFMLTKDSLFLNMARAGAWGRDAFADPKTSVLSYYWNAMNRGPGPFPHHAWWQIGWITDYLLSEIALRSNNAIQFPHGFITPKVGPHTSYGFAPGTVYGQKAELLLKEGLVTTGSPYVDYLTAIDRTQQKLYVFLLNNDDEARNTTVKLDYSKLLPGKTVRPVQTMLLKGDRRTPLPAGNVVPVRLPAFGLQVIEVEYSE